ncbi:hypothetical protein BD410DRAFT_709650 [Rickenella mellea]|uniref:20S-pre-rRNA D-site endonuclease NOB1 n=1 Tax=Rickenella mellea TaxID=50990 RepID=A0A4V3AZN6_9AGAM|nr:hypothetical protein BD410DRAFT_709650 [Rickenella mellea]
MAAVQPRPSCKTLVLDAGPLLSLSPLRGLAETYITVPQVLDELKDRRAREHFERLGLSAGVKIEVKEPDLPSLVHVTQFAKKTGDYSVLSHADLCVLALTYALDLKEKAEKLRVQAATVAQNADQIASNENAKSPSLDGEDSVAHDSADVASDTENDVSQTGDLSGGDQIGQIGAEEVEDEEEDDPLNVVLEPLHDSEIIPLSSTNSPSQPLDDDTALQATSGKPLPQTQSVIFEDPSDSDDGEGDWITPENVAVHKSHALNLLPSSNSMSDSFTVVSSKTKKRNNKRRANAESQGVNDGEQIGAGCMTADFAMQNVLLQLGLNLVGVEGKRIQRVKNWVLRCHACFKICKDSTKKFCPSCGNATLLRTSVTVSSPTADDSTPTMQVHLKKNFQYRTRGTVYSIPAPKPGSSKKGSGEGLILREDQTEYLRAKKQLDGKREREDKRMVQGALEAGKSGASGVGVGSWMDPDWMPEMMSVGIGGKGRSLGNNGVGADGMPVIGYGRKNPNERRRKK